MDPEIVLDALPWDLMCKTLTPEARALARSHADFQLWTLTLIAVELNEIRREVRNVTRPSGVE